MDTIKRYDLEVVCSQGEAWQELNENPEGDWVSHDDHTRVVKVLCDRIKELKEQLVYSDLECQELKEKFALSEQENKDLWGCLKESREKTEAHVEW